MCHGVHVPLLGVPPDSPNTEVPVGSKVSIGVLEYLLPIPISPISIK